ncbi:hypothetical protein NHP190002_06640 [Helicobacter ailurogastricus]|nr:hypothetical protein NHP190002_06640 [Helicobacter ailurogastricus]
MLLTSRQNVLLRPHEHRCKRAPKLGTIILQSLYKFSFVPLHKKNKKSPVKTWVSQADAWHLYYSWGQAPKPPREGFEVKDEFVLWFYGVIAVKRDFWFKTLKTPLQ